MNCYENKDAWWFVDWCNKNGIDARIRNSVSRAMVIEHLGIDTILNMDESGFIGWKGLGVKSRTAFMAVRDKLKMDWMEANA